MEADNFCHFCKRNLSYQNRTSLLCHYCARYAFDIITKKNNYSKNDIINIRTMLIGDLDKRFYDIGLYDKFIIQEIESDVELLSDLMRSIRHEQ